MILASLQAVSSKLNSHRVRPAPVATRPMTSITINPHPGQAAVLDAKQPVVAAIAGTGGGKTVAGMVWLVLQMAQHRGETWLVVEPTWPMVDRVLLHSSQGRWGLLKLLQALDPGAFFHHTDRTIYSKMGTVYLASATHPESMEGAHVAGAWLDEAGQMSRLAFETATRRASFKRGQVLLTTTPYNRGWLYQDIYIRWRDGDPAYFVSQFPSLANPAYPREVYDRNRRTMSQARFHMMHEGGFERPEGMVYDRWEDSMIVEPFSIPPDWNRFGAVDFGFNHPTAAVWAARDPDGVYYLFQVYKKAGDLLANHARALLDRSPNGAQPSVWYADPSARQQRAEMARLGIPLSPADNDVANGIDTLSTLMATGRFKVFRSCAAWLDEVEGYVWETKHELPTDRPVKVNDDLMDATRYLVHTQEKRQGLRLYT